MYQDKWTIHDEYDFDESEIAIKDFIKDPTQVTRNIFDWTSDSGAERPWDFF